MPRARHRTGVSNQIEPECLTCVCGHNRASHFYVEKTAHEEGYVGPCLCMGCDDGKNPCRRYRRAPATK